VHKSRLAGGLVAAANGQNVDEETQAGQIERATQVVSRSQAEKTQRLLRLVAVAEDQGCDRPAGVGDPAEQANSLVWIGPRAEVHQHQNHGIALDAVGDCLEGIECFECQAGNGVHDPFDGLTKVVSELINRAVESGMGELLESPSPTPSHTSRSQVGRGGCVTTAVQRGTSSHGRGTPWCISRGTNRVDRGGGLG
jgi:hypothetical protein